jgi:O-antigen/teichoic acid export membrane protein
MTQGISLLRRNSFFALSSTAIRLLSNAVMFIIIARFYGPESFGQFTTAHTLSTIFILLADFGFDLLLTTQIAADRQRASVILPRMLALKLIFSFFASAIMCAVPLLGSLSLQASKLIYIFSLYVFFSAALNFFFALFKGYEEFQHEALISFLLNVLLFVALIFLGFMKMSLAWIACVFIGSRIFGLGLALLRSKKFIPSIFPVWDLQWLRNIKSQIVYFGLFMIFGNLFFTLDTILLSFWKGDYQVGVYQAVFRIIAITLVIPDIAINTLLPTLTRIYAVDKDRWRRLGLLASKTLFFIALFFGFVIIFSAEDIITIAYGKAKFLDAVPILKIFGIVIIIRYTTEIPALMLTTSNRQSVRMVLVILATIINVGLNSFAIPKFNALGAAYTSLLTNLLVGICYFVASGGVIKWRLFSMERCVPLFTILAGSVIMLICSVPLWIGIIGVLMIYILIVYYLGYNAQEKVIILEEVLSFKLS